MDTRQFICSRIEGYLAATGMSERRFGINAVKDHKFLKRLRTDAGVTLTVIERAEAFMVANPPSTSDALSVNEGEA